MTERGASADGYCRILDATECLSQNSLVLMEEVKVRVLPKQEHPAEPLAQDI